jgi:hypothetical protein
LNERGYIKTNEHLRTTAPEVWAIGEMAGSPQFTHASVDDFRVVHDSIQGGKSVTTGRQVPFCLFTDPEFARIGLSEKEPKANAWVSARWLSTQGKSCLQYRLLMTAGVPYTALRDGLFSHPTLVEGLIRLFSAAVSQPMATEADAIAARDTKRAAASHTR